jgi:hypothetical protein
MKHKLPLLFCMLCFSLIASAQDNYEDVVYLKNGSIIHGMIIEQVPNVSIKIKSGQNVFVYKIEEIEKITKEEVEGSSGGSGLGSDYGFKSTGFAGNYEIGLSHFPKGDNIPMFAIMAITGYHFNPYVSAGLGVGAELSGKDVFNFPVFADLRFYFTKTRIAPFTNLAGGYNVMLVKGSDFYYYSSDTEANHGFMFNPAMGMRFAINKKIAATMSLGYKYIGSIVEGFDGNEINSYHAITLRWGIAL